MFLNRSENWSRIVGMWTSFSVFEKKLCFTPVVSPGSVIATFVRKYFYWNMSFCDLQIEVIPQSSITIDYSLFCKPVFSQNTMVEPFIRVLTENVLPVKGYFFENRWFCVFGHNPYSPKTLKKTIVFELSRFSNWPSAATTGLSSSIKIWKEDHTFLDADSIEKPMIKIHASKFCWSKISRKVYVKTIHLDYRNGVSPWLQRLDFLRDCPKQQLCT